MQCTQEALIHAWPRPGSGAGDSSCQPACSSQNSQEAGFISQPIKVDPLQLLLGGPLLARVQHNSASICAAFKWEGGRKIKKKEMQRAVPPDSSEEFPSTHLGFGPSQDTETQEKSIYVLMSTQLQI